LIERLRVLTPLREQVHNCVAWIFYYILNSVIPKSQKKSRVSISICFVRNIKIKIEYPKIEKLDWSHQSIPAAPPPLGSAARISHSKKRIIFKNNHYFKKRIRAFLAKESIT
jgi:hypothetical protein